MCSLSHWYCLYCIFVGLHVLNHTKTWCNCDTKRIMFLHFVIWGTEVPPYSVTMLYNSKTAGDNNAVVSHLQRPERVSQTIDILWGGVSLREDEGPLVMNLQGIFLIGTLWGLSFSKTQKSLLFLKCLKIKHCVVSEITCQRSSILLRSRTLLK